MLIAWISILPLSRSERSREEVCKACVTLSLGSDNWGNKIWGLVEGHAAISRFFNAIHLMVLIVPSLWETQNRPKHHFPSVDRSAKSNTKDDEQLRVRDDAMISLSEKEMRNKPSIISINDTKSIKDNMMLIFDVHSVNDEKRAHHDFDYQTRRKNNKSWFQPTVIIPWFNNPWYTDDLTVYNDSWTHQNIS